MLGQLSKKLLNILNIYFYYLIFSLHDFEEAIKHVKASVSIEDLKIYSEWNKTFGSFHNG